MGRVVDNSDVYVQIHGSTLGEILNDGKFVSIFDDEADSAIGEGFGTEHREDYERRTFGINSEWLPPDKRPIYGYLWDSDDKDGGVIPETMLSLGDPRAALMNYGHIAVRLKPGIRDRTRVAGFPRPTRRGPGRFHSSGRSCHSAPPPV